MTPQQIQLQNKRQEWNKKFSLIRPYISEQIRCDWARNNAVSRSTVYNYLMHGKVYDVYLAERMFDGLVEMAGLSKSEVKKILKGEVLQQKPV